MDFELMEKGVVQISLDRKRDEEGRVAHRKNLHIVELQFSSGLEEQ